MTETDVFPFGKYKGVPLSAVLNDAGYCEWLLGQAWLSERHPELVDFLCNGESSGNDTPLHNMLQARFLDPEFQLKFIRLGLERSVYYREYIERMRYAHPKTVEFECDGFDVILRGEPVRWDEVHIDGHTMYSNRVDPFFLVEVKPSLSDDYPAVLRQIKTALKVRASRYKGWNEDGEPVLFLGSFSSKSINAEQLREIFAMSSIIVIFATEIDEVVLEHDTQSKAHENAE